MEKKERNEKVLRIYVDQANYNIEETVKIIEKIPELAGSFTGKDIRRSCMGILQSMQVWKKLEKPATVKSEKDITKKQLANILCKALEIELVGVPTLLNLKKVEIAFLIDALTTFIKVDGFDDVQEFLDKQEV